MEQIGNFKIHETILRDCKQKRERALFEAEKRLDELGKKNPHILDIRHELLKSAYEFSVDMRMTKDETQRIKLRNDMLMRLETLKAEQTNALVSMNLPENYLEPVFSCSYCEDKGLVGGPIKQPCRCVLQRTMQLKYASSNLENGEYFETYNPAIFKDSRQKRQNAALLEYAKNYAEEIPYLSTPNMLLIGSTGLGKSFMLNCIGHRALERGLSVVKVTAYNLIKSALDSVRTYETLVDYSDIDLLLIDDLGTEPTITNITQEHLFAIINERHVQFKNTVIATNLNFENLQEAYGERLFSRLISPKHTKIFELTGDDLRLFSV